MAGSDIPFFVVHLDHRSREIKFDVFDAVTGKAWHRSYKTYTVPDGQYVVKLTLTKALGDSSNPAHVETWTSPVVTVARP